MTIRASLCSSNQIDRYNHITNQSINQKSVFLQYTCIKDEIEPSGAALKSRTVKIQFLYFIAPYLAH